MQRGRRSCLKYVAEPCSLDEIVQPYLHAARIAVHIVDEVFAVPRCHVLCIAVKCTETPLIDTDRIGLEVLHGDVAGLLHEGKFIFVQQSIFSYRGRSAKQR